MARHLDRKDTIAWRRCRGMNDWDSPDDLPDDLCALANNVQFEQGGLGKKRQGSIYQPITFTATPPGYAYLANFVPAGGAAVAELFIVGENGTMFTVRVANTAISLTLADAMLDAPPIVHTAQLNNKLVIAYRSAVNRLHVLEAGGTTGLCAAAPNRRGTLANAARKPTPGAGDSSARARSKKAGAPGQRSATSDVSACARSDMAIVYYCGCGGQAADGSEVIHSSMSAAPSSSTTLEPSLGMRTSASAVSRACMRTDMAERVGWPGTTRYWARLSSCSAAPHRFVAASAVPKRISTVLNSPPGRWQTAQLV